MSNQQIGLFILVGAALLAIIGLLVWTGAFSWFGRLPGDIRIEGERSRVYIPITSMLLLSIVLSIAFSLFRRLF